MRPGVMDEQKVADVNFRQAAVDGKLVVVFAVQPRNKAVAFLRILMLFIHPFLFFLPAEL